MNELSVLKKQAISSSTKEEIANSVSAYLEDIAFNGGNVLDDLAVCRKFIFLLQEMEKGLIPFAITDLGNYDKNETNVNNVDLKVVESGSRYDYTANSAWVKQKAVLDAEADKLKGIESFSKGLRESAKLLDEETGELIEYYPPVKSSSTTIRATLK